MDQNLRERAVSLQNWLSTLVPPIPADKCHFEVTPETVAALEKYRDSETAKIAKEKAEISALKAKTAAVKGKTKKLRQDFPVLKELEKNLTEESRETLTQLSQVAAAMGLEEFRSETSFLAAANAHLADQMDKSAELKRLEKEEEKLITLNSSVQSKRTKLQEKAELKKTQKEAKQQQMGEDMQAAQFYCLKAGEYTEKIRQLKEDLSHADFSEAISHPALMERSKEIDSLMAKVDKLEVILAAYKDLPPDYNLAKVKLTEQRQLLTDWQKKLKETVAKPKTN